MSDIIFEEASGRTPGAITPIRAESIRTLYQQVRTTLGAALVLTTYMAISSAPYTPWPPIALWVAVALSSFAVREVLVRTFFARQPKDEDLERWARYHTCFQVLTGCLWGSTIFLFGHPEEPITIALVLSCLYSIPSGTVPALAYNPPGLVALVVPIFGSVFIRLVATGSFGFTLVGIATVLYGVTMLGFCRVQARAVAEGFRIRFENRELVAALTAEKAEAESARREAERASLAKSQFLAAASHDLRQPLYALSLFSASLGALRLDQDGRSVVGRIQDSIAAMESLFVGLLDVSRLDAGVVKAQTAAIPVDAMFDRLSQYFLPIAEERGLDLRFRSDGEWVDSDVTLLEQVLSNLVSNALRYTNTGGVLVAARKRGGCVRFEVWDTGIGIAESDRRRIFEEFVQVENSVRDRRKGLGLGLSIAQRSAALLGGSVEIASRPGKGSRFMFMQPVAAPRPAEQRASDMIVSVSAQIPGDLPVLIVDDDADVRAALSDLLTRWNVRFDMVAQAADALARVSAGSTYRAVLADYRLPGTLNGLDLITELRLVHPAPAPACVLITGDFDPELIRAAEALGVPLFHKPLRPEKLRGLLGLADVQVVA